VKKNTLTYISVILLSGIISLAAYSARPKRTTSGVRRDKQRTEQRIRLTQDQIRENRRKTERSLNQLNALNADISKQRRVIATMNDSIRRTEREISRTNDSITALERDVDVIRRSYANALRTARRRRRGADDLAFIFSARTFAQSLSRYRYLKTFSQWLGKKAVDLRSTITELSAKKAHLDSLRTSRLAALARLNEANDMLLAQQSATKVLVDQLQTDKTSLNAYLKEQQQQMRRLDEELDRLIAEELRKAEEEQRRREEQERLRRAEEERLAAAQQSTDTPQKSSKRKKKNDKKNSDQAKPGKPAITAAPAPPSKTTEDNRHLAAAFADNRGRLPSPVSGSYRIVKPFGVTKHPNLPNVLVENSGIDIDVSGNQTALAVFDGIVTVIFRPSGYQTVIVVRHGDYLTVYGNLDAVHVAKGDKVKCGQALGHIYANPADDNRAILHFEVRKGREKLNPQQWIR